LHKDSLSIIVTELLFPKQFRILLHDEVNRCVSSLDLTVEAQSEQQAVFVAKTRLMREGYIMLGYEQFIRGGEILTIEGAREA